MTRLVELLNEEYLLWKSFSTIQEVADDYRYLITPSAKGSSANFLNIAIPKTNFKDFSNSLIQEHESIFSKHKSSGNFVALPDPSLKHCLLEDSEYFNIKQSHESTPIKSYYSDALTIEQTDDLEFFAEVIQQGFSYPTNFIGDFVKRMKSIEASLDTHFFLLKLSDNPIGAVSYFKSPAGSHYCMMNATILAPHRGRGYMSFLLSETRKKIDNDIFARTNNPSMKSSLKKSGYTSGGAFYICSNNKFL